MTKTLAQYIETALWSSTGTECSACRYEWIVQFPRKDER